MKVNYLNGAGQDRMLRNGWMLMLPISYTETAEKMHERLTALGYTQVKVYWEGTQIRGIHRYFAFVKR